MIFDPMDRSRRFREPSRKETLISLFIVVVMVVGMIFVAGNSKTSNSEPTIDSPSTTVTESVPLRGGPVFIK